MNGQNLPVRVGDGGGVHPRRSPGGRRLPWGGVEFYPNELDPHFTILGIVNSGKTLTMRMLMRGALMGGPGKLLHRALVFDPKGDFYPILVGMGIPRECIAVLHPFDARSTAWDLAADIKDAASSRQLATILAPPDDKSSQPFFSTAARELVAGVIDALREKAPGAWTLNDVCEMTRTASKLEETLACTDDGLDLIDTYLRKDRQSDDVVATLRTKLAPYITAARLWARAERRISLTDWARSLEPAVLLLGTDDANAASISALNRAVLKRASELVAGRYDEEPRDESWFFIDEARWAGELDGLSTLLVKGRTKGARVVLGFQDLQGLRHVYGREQADEFVAMCGNVAVLRIDSPDTRAWASRYFGKYEGYVASFSHTYAKEESVTHQWSLQQREAVLEQEFHAIPPPMPGYGIPGVFRCPFASWRDTVPSAFIDAWLAPKSGDPGFVPRGREDQGRLPSHVLSQLTKSKAKPLLNADQVTRPVLRVPDWSVQSRPMNDLGTGPQ